MPPAPPSTPKRNAPSTSARPSPVRGTKPAWQYRSPRPENEPDESFKPGVYSIPVEQKVRVRRVAKNRRSSMPVTLEEATLIRVNHWFHKVNEPPEVTHLCRLKDGTEAWFPEAETVPLEDFDQVRVVAPLPKRSSRRRSAPDDPTKELTQKCENESPSPAALTPSAADLGLLGFEKLVIAKRTLEDGDHRWEAGMQVASRFRFRKNEAKLPVITHCVHFADGKEEWFREDDTEDIEFWKEFGAYYPPSRTKREPRADGAPVLSNMLKTLNI